VGGPAWSWCSPGKGRYKVEVEVLSDAVQGVGEVIVVMSARTVQPCRSEGPSVSLCSLLWGKTSTVLGGSTWARKSENCSVDYIELPRKIASALSTGFVTKSTGGMYCGKHGRG